MKNMQIMKFTILLLGLMSLIQQSGNAQEVGFAGASNFAAQYQLGNKDEILMNVNVWGYVRKPGQYVVPRHTDLISLISFAGGPVEGASLNTVRIIRAGQTLLASSDSKDIQNELAGSAKAPILNVKMQDYMDNGEMGKIPILEAGDTVIIPQSSGNKVTEFLGFKSLFAVIGAVVSIVYLVDRIGR
jgi:hypothetical protein